MNKTINQWVVKNNQRISWELKSLLVAEPFSTCTNKDLKFQWNGTKTICSFCNVTCATRDRIKFLSSQVDTVLQTRRDWKLWRIVISLGFSHRALGLNRLNFTLTTHSHCHWHQLHIFCKYRDGTRQQLISGQLQPRAASPGELILPGEELCVSLSLPSGQLLWLSGRLNTWMYSYVLRVWLRRVDQRGNDCGCPREVSFAAKASVISGRGTFFIKRKTIWFITLKSDPTSYPTWDFPLLLQMCFPAHVW